MKKRKNKKEFLNKKIIIYCEGQTEKIFISFIKKLLNSKVEIKYKNLKGEIKSEIILSKVKDDKNSYENIDKVYLICDFEHSKEMNKLKTDEFYKVISKPSFEIIILFFLQKFQESKILILIEKSNKDIIKEIESISKVEYSKNSEILNSFLEKIST